VAYHFLDSGLGDVWLENGVNDFDTAYGPGTSITDLDGLHRAIGLWLVRRPAPLDGAALRFIRRDLDATQPDLARRLGVEEQALRRWEKVRTRPLHGAVDRLLRGLYSEWLGLNEPISSLVGRIDDSAGPAPVRGLFRLDPTGWVAVEPVPA
jgi:DNA-binding transcriptional regulator YiaG